MGNWNITIRGTGQHHNIDADGNEHPNDAQKLAKDFVCKLIGAGHNVMSATITHGGEENLIQTKPEG